MIILATPNQKGGCGKTSLALNLAAVLATPRHKAALINGILRLAQPGRWPDPN